MRVFEGITEAADAVSHNKLRTFLSLLGMIIGTASVVAVMSAGAMMSHKFIDQADSIGARLIVVYNNWELNDYTASRVYMSNRDVDAMRARNPGALFVRVNDERRTAVRGNVTQKVRIVGVDPGYFDIWPRTFISGRKVTQADEDSLAKVCILTEDYAAAFFPDGKALGSTLTIGSFDYLVVGIAALGDSGSLMSDGTNRETVFFPYSALERTIDWSWTGSPKVFELMVRAGSLDRVNATATNIESYLTRIYGTVDGQCRFKVEKIDGALTAIRTIFAAVTAVVAFIAGISLFVSGIGIMNVMLVAVAERTHEIGIRKAIGAHSSDIMMQFLTESLFICLSGGAIGIALGTGIARVISAITKWPFVMPVGAPVTALLVSAAVGIFFGLMPARNAAALDPVIALTKE